MLPALFTRSQGLRKLYGNLCAPLLARHGLTQLELDIILFLANNPEYDTARDIVEKRHLAKSHVSMGIDNLAGRGLLERSTRDGNRKTIHLHLTGEAAPIVAEGRAAQRQYGALLFTGFTAEDFRLLASLMDRVAGNMDAALAAEERG